MAGFMELAQKRTSTRRFSDTRVEHAKLERCIDAARMAPSACNAQPWKFIVCDEPELVGKIAVATVGPLVTFNKFLEKAPAIVVITAEPGTVISAVGGAVKSIPYHLLDIGIAAGHFCLQAAEEGVGTCMIGWFHAGKIRRLLGIPRSRRIALLIAMGYPESDIKTPKRRKDMKEISSYNSYT